MFTQTKTEPLTIDGIAVAQPDRLYNVEGTYLAFDDLLLTGNIDGPLMYRGKKITILHIMEKIGVLVGYHGARGPVLRGVLCLVEDK